MSLPAFDTHAYVKTLKAAGFTEQQAETQAELNAKILSELVTEKLATKGEIAELKLATKDEIAALKLDIAGLRQATREQITELRHSIKSYSVGVIIIWMCITIVNFIHLIIPSFHI